MPNNPPTPLKLDTPFTNYRKEFVHTQADPLVINWKGKIGYGDIISPISYAMNIAEKNSTDVLLRFHWPYDKPRKYNEYDSETIQDWIDLTYNILEKPQFWNVIIEHVYDSKLNYNHDNYLVDNFHCHNLRFAAHGWNDGNNGHSQWRNVTMVTSIKHKETWDEYDKHKAWKDPLAYTPSGFAWPKVGALIEKRNWRLRYVHYRDPMQNVINVMARSRGVVGYHGAHMWIARMLGLPMVIFSKKPLTEKAFPWCVRFEYYTDFNPDALEELFQMSIEKREKLRRDYEYYLSEPNIHRLRSERS